jgi:hypothetical protein
MESVHRLIRKWQKAHQFRTCKSSESGAISLIYLGPLSKEMQTSSWLIAMPAFDESGLRWI